MTSFSGPFYCSSTSNLLSELYYDPEEVLDQYLGTGEPLRI